MSANMRPVAVRGDPQHRDAGRHRRPAALTAGGIDYATPTGRMFADILAALADYERALMHGRAPAARTAARLRGRHTGRRSSHRRRPDSAEPCVVSRSTSWSVATASRTTVCRAQRDSDPAPPPPEAVRPSGTSRRRRRARTRRGRQLALLLTKAKLRRMGTEDGDPGCRRLSHQRRERKDPAPPSRRNRHALNVPPDAAPGEQYG